MAKLLMISGDRALVAGQPGAFYNTLEDFSRHWERIDVICPRPKLKIGNLKLFDNVFLHPSPWPLLLQPWWIWRQGRRLHRQQGFSLATVHEYAPFYNGLGARWLSQESGLPYVLEIHHITGFPRAATLREWFYHWLFRFFIRWDAVPAKAVRAVNQTIAEALQRIGVPANKIRLMPSLYLDRQVFRPQPVEKKYDLIFVGRLAANKGAELFIQAAGQFQVKAIIVGAGPLERELKTLNAKLKADVTFHGWAKDRQAVAALLNQSRLLVVPSYSEGNPRVLGEALACGVPVLATPVGIAPELLDRGGAGRIVGWDAAGIAQQAQILLADPAAYQQCRECGLALVRQYEKSAAVKNYADQLKTVRCARQLLVVTQTVAADDQLLAFFLAWLKQFSRHFQTVRVICLGKGQADLPANVTVHSLGKERGWPKLAQLFRFYYLLWRYRQSYDAVFVHMNPIWLMLGGPLWRRWGKRTALWYTSGGVTSKLRWAERQADLIFTASPESFRLPSSKLVVTGHGIDTDWFKPANQPAVPTELKLLSVGRLAPVKHYGTLIQAAGWLAERKVSFSVTVIGEPALPADRVYTAELKNTIRQLDLEQHFHFLGKVNYAQLPEYYRQHSLFIHLSRTGSLDKALLEAMACGLTVLSASAAARAFLPPALTLAPDDAAELAGKIQTVGRQMADPALRRYVLEHHDLTALISRISRRISE